MGTISVPLTAKLEETMDNLVLVGHGSSKADIVRRAITAFAEEQAVLAVLRSEQEARECKILKGDLRKLVKRMSV